MSDKNLIRIKQGKTEWDFYDIPNELIDKISNILQIYTTKRQIEETEERLNSIKEKMKLLWQN